MEEAMFAFFRDGIGPDMSSVLAPANLRHLGPQARESFIRRLKKQLATSGPDANVCHRLGVLLWQNDNLPQATACLAQAVKMAPTAGETILCLGLVLEAQGETARAKAIYQACSARGGKTIWAVYARDRLKQLDAA